jgi:hypothetical protein
LVPEIARIFRIRENYLLRLVDTDGEGILVLGTAGRDDHPGLSDLGFQG